uniref:Protein CYR61-like n=1 Tax=Cynoglossus semilaevis TaxID=244447 RepID=A0A3P8USS7_CYNSE
MCFFFSPQLFILFQQHIFFFFLHNSSFHSNNTGIILLCNCPSESLSCPAGVSAVLDQCGCCKVCAAQLNQDCSPTTPCDHHKGLECNYGNDVTMAWGICRAKSEGRSCEYNGRIYQNGESFRAGCKHQCTCIDGAVGCAPLCNNKLPPASSSCPYPQLVRKPGQCCFSVDSNIHPGPQQHENNLLLTNKLSDVKFNDWESEPAWNHVKKRKCPVQVTEWSPCSRSCGMGVSSRVTNRNPECKLERETRICNIRPCRGLTIPAKKEKKCSPTQKAPKPIHLFYGECASVRLYRPTYCGVCKNGRCCSPRHSRTVPVTFVCQDGERLQKSVMFIQSCKCSEDCEHLNDVALPSQHWMYGDTHKFID